MRPYYADGMNVYLPGGCLTPFCATWPPVTQTIRYGIRAYPGYQHVNTRMNFANGTVALHDPPGLWATTTTVTVNNATTPVNAYAEMVEQPTLEVEVKVEDDIVPAAYAGHFTFSTNGYSAAKKFSTYQVETPTYTKYTELYAVTAAPHNGHTLWGWTGNCAYFDANGNYLGMLPEDLGDEPSQWITDETIYVKCLKLDDEQPVESGTLELAASSNIRLLQPTEGRVALHTSPRVHSQRIAAPGDANEAELCEELHPVLPGEYYELGSKFRFCVPGLSEGKSEGLFWVLMNSNNEPIATGLGDSFEFTFTPQTQGEMQVYFMKDMVVLAQSPNFLARPLLTNSLAIDYSLLLRPDPYTPSVPVAQRIVELWKGAEVRLRRKDTAYDYRACCKLAVAVTGPFDPDSNGDGKSDINDNRPDPAYDSDDGALSKQLRDKHYAVVDVAYVSRLGVAGLCDMADTGNIVIGWLQTIREGGAIEAHEFGHRKGRVGLWPAQTDYTAVNLKKYVMYVEADASSNLLTKADAIAISK